MNGWRNKWRKQYQFCRIFSLAMSLACGTGVVLQASQDVPLISPMPMALTATTSSTSLASWLNPMKWGSQATALGLVKQRGTLTEDPLREAPSRSFAVMRDNFEDLALERQAIKRTLMFLHAWDQLSAQARKQERERLQEKFDIRGELDSPQVRGTVITQLMFRLREVEEKIKEDAGGYQLAFNDHLINQKKYFASRVRELEQLINHQNEVLNGMEQAIFKEKEHALMLDAQYKLLWQQLVDKNNELGTTMRYRGRDLMGVRSSIEQLGREVARLEDELTKIGNEREKHMLQVRKQSDERNELLKQLNNGMQMLTEVEKMQRARQGKSFSQHLQSLDLDDVVTFDEDDGEQDHQQREDDDVQQMLVQDQDERDQENNEQDDESHTIAPLAPPPPPAPPMPQSQVSASPAPPPPPAPAPSLSQPVGTVQLKKASGSSRGDLLDQIRAGKQLKKASDRTLSEPDSSATPQDSRSALLKQIQGGVSLKKVETPESGVKKEKEPEDEGIFGALSRVLAARRNAIDSEDEEENNNNDEDWDDESGEN